MNLIPLPTPPPLFFKKDGNFKYVKLKRDIDKIPRILEGFDYKRKKCMELRTKAALAMILADTTRKEITTEGPEVADAISKTINIATKINEKFIKQLVKRNIYESLESAKLKGVWRNLPNSIKIKYSSLLEEKSLRKNNINIGRCKKRWLSERFLYKAYVASRSE